MRITKIMQISKLKLIIIEIINNLRIPLKNHENNEKILELHRKLRKSGEHLNFIENNENHNIPYES